MSDQTTISPVTEREIRTVQADGLRAGMITVDHGAVARVRFIAHGIVVVTYDDEPDFIDRMTRIDPVDVYVSEFVD